MQIRLATKEDLNEIARVYCESFNKVSDENWTEENAQMLFEFWLTRQPDLFFIASNNGKIVGGAVASAKPWFDGIRIQDGELFVAPDYQKQGVGRALLTRLIEEGVNKYNANVFEAITFAGAEFPLSWYKSLSFKQKENLIVITGNCNEILQKLKI